VTVSYIDSDGIHQFQIETSGHYEVTITGMDYANMIEYCDWEGIGSTVVVKAYLNGDLVDQQTGISVTKRIHLILS
jgi:hypothetical protein